MKNEYIDKRATINAIMESSRPATMVVQDMPVADVVEVCRCKDCFEYMPTGSCYGLCSLDYHKVQCTDYCSSANRK
jgi:hypothetical protein